MITTKEVNGIAGLKSIKGEWQQLTADMDHCRFFHQWSWYKSYLCHLSENPESVYFVLFFIHNELRAIVPYVKNTERKYGLNFKTLSFPNHPHLNLSDIVIARSKFDFFSENILTFLQKKKGLNWDYFRMTKLLEESPVVQAVLDRSLSGTACVPMATSDYVACNNVASHALTLSSKFKRNLRRLLKRAEKKGAVSFHYIVDAQDLPSAYQDFLKAEASGWKGGDGTETAIKLNEKLADFYASLVQEFSATHQCQINLLKIDDDCVAAQFCLINQGTLHILKIGYDEAFDDVAPGSLLLFDLLNRCSDDPNVQFISFVTGPPWTKRWHADSHTVYEALFFNKSLKGYLTVSLYKLKNLISSTLHNEKT